MNFKELGKPMKCEFKEMCKYMNEGCQDDHILLTLGCPHRDKVKKQIGYNQRQREYEYPGFKRISELARHDPLIYAHIRMFEAEQVSWEELKTLAILELAKQRNELQKHYLQKMREMPPEVYFPHRPY